jgi:hypothetical protein
MPALVFCSGPRANDATVRGFGLVMRLALRRTVRAENAVVAPGAARPTACKNLCGPAVGLDDLRRTAMVGLV